MRAVLTLCFTLLFAGFVPLASLAQGGVENVGQQAVSDLNAMRAQNGLGALSVDKKLTAAAAGHAADMVKKGFFSHSGSNGSTIGKRARKQRYKFCVIAENIAKGQRSVDEVLTTWMGSSGHRANILNTGVTEFGLVRGTGNLWVMVLGRSGC